MENGPAYQDHKLEELARGYWQESLEELLEGVTHDELRHNIHHKIVTEEPLTAAEVRCLLTYTEEGNRLDGAGLGAAPPEDEEEDAWEVLLPEEASELPDFGE